MTGLSGIEEQHELSRSPHRSKLHREHMRLNRLVLKGLVSRMDLEAAAVEASSCQRDIESILLNQYHVPKAELGAALSEHYGYPYIPYHERTVTDPALLKNLSLDYFRRNAWMPLRREGDGIHVVMNDPHDVEKQSDIRRAFPGSVIRMGIALRCDIDQFLTAATRQLKTGSIAAIIGELVTEAALERAGEAEASHIDENDSAIVRLASQIIADAHRLGASDVHIEPYSGRKETAVRFRIDGSCSTYMKIPAAYRRAIVSRIKIMAHLDIAERRKPQDGKIRYTLPEGEEIELRVATLPTAGANEDVVMRLLTNKGGMILDDMDFSPGVLDTIKALAEKPYGMILCVGPTGSGKTTTLHAMLKHINTDERKIWTAEDPIEITQEGLRQVQVHPKIGLTFAAAMRSFLRADPDVIMIGEMRDKETADVAIEASLTGHLVMSTLHTNSAVETVTRLLDMGCDSFNFADAMLGVLAQRLCKRICEHCKEAYHPTRQEYEELMQGYGVQDWDGLGISYTADFMLYRGCGCDACNNTGFKGRVAIHELLAGTEEIKNFIQSKARTAETLELARRQGMVTLVQDGIQKVLQGLTTYRQVRAVAMK
ncbi:GspE/PulE family protein [Nitrospira moscoviensis]|uniref:Putative Type IV pilus assembly protein PilB n=1 Tax=Nitrospira moscoviensis TaxID=42253 RepID=A0A0K2GIQ2_NITMO|nr:GspE/PulE family protein [Nitrospira moscoviensis]ALA60825.1 putative Type IV pilus assembly protein PilB [Nitrospira moscoviensis]